MLKLLAGIAALTFISACTTTGTLSSSADSRPGTGILGAGPGVSTQGFGPSVAPLGSGGPGLDTIYLPG